MSDLKVNQNIPLQNLDASSTDSNKSIQMIFAELQTSLAQMNRTKASGIIGEIKEQQNRSKAYAQLINSLRTMSEDKGKGRLPDKMPTDPKEIDKELEACKKISPDELAKAEQLKRDIEAYRQAIREGKNSDLPTTQEGIDAYRAKYGNAQWMQALRIREYCIKSGIHIDPKMSEGKLNEILGEVNKTAKYNSAYMNALNAYKGLSQEGINLSDKPDVKQIQNWMASIQTVQDQCGSDIQQRMIYVQDYIGQYNSYTQGANTAINTANQTLGNLARGQ